MSEIQLNLKNNQKEPEKQVWLIFCNECGSLLNFEGKHRSYSNKKCGEIDGDLSKMAIYNSIAYDIEADIRAQLEKANAELRRLQLIIKEMESISDV